MILNRVNFKHFINQIILFTSVMLFSTLCSAGIYKWVDAEGNVHYSQQRPTNTSSEKMNVQKHAPQDTSSYKRPTLKSSDTQTGKAPKAAENEEVKETRAEKKKRMADCKQIRNNLASMESRGRIRSRDDEGNITYLSDKEKQARITKSKKTLAKNCK